MTQKVNRRSAGRYAPRGACRQVFLERESEILIAGPAGTGKSRACLEKLHAAALANKGMRGLICRKTGATLSSTALVTWRRFVVNDSLLAGDVWYYGGSAQEPPQYRYSNGSTVVIGGLDKVSKIMSAEYDVIYVQEATELTEDDWESLTTRLRNWVMSFQQLLADCNPSAPTHWLKVRCDNGRTKLLVSTHEDNPILFARDGEVTDRGKDYLSKLDRLTGVRYDRLRLGKWVSAEGSIYDNFNSEVHIIDEIPAGERDVDKFGVPLKWPRFWGVDFGFVNPFVLQCWAEDEDGRLYLYREMYMTRRTVDQHGKEIINIVAPCAGHCGSEEAAHNCRDCSRCETPWLEPKPRAVICDTDAEGRATLEKEIGMSTSPAHKSVLEGIEAVQVRLRDAGDGRPRIFILRNALVRADPELTDSARPTCTLEEIPGYVWANKAKEAPVKLDDHGCDALRYVVADRDFGIRAIFRSFTV
jgi:phage terminase large subunit